MTSDLVSYFERSPDPTIGACMNTGKADTDGVVFNYIEPLVGTYCFVGRQSLLEAVAVMTKMSVDDVKTALGLKAPAKKGVNG